MKNTVIISPVNMKERAALGIRAGDTVRVWQKITEEVTEGKTTKMKSRLQAFEGTVITTKHGSEAGATFTVRKSAAGGIGVERIFPLYSPAVDKIEITRRSKVRRAKLYYIRDAVSREMKRALRKMRMVDISTKGGAELEAEAAKIAADEKATQDRIDLEAKIAADALAAAQVSETVAAGDDLVTWIEGIGPKIAEVFAENGITTFTALADADTEAMKKILADNSLASHDPATWAQQAALARDGKWDELKALHKELDGGKITA